jgi:hypothetical protein
VGASAGLSWTFDNGVEIGSFATNFNLLARPSWDQTIPGDVIGLSISSWL